MIQEQARPAAFWPEAAVLVLFLAASAAPTPLYRVYQARWGFSATTLTAVFAVYVVFLLMAVLPEPGTVRPGALASLKPDISVPRPARGTFARAAPCLIAVWALGGFYLSLGPSLAAQLSGSHNLLWGGVIAFLLTGLGAVTAAAFRNSAPIAVMLGGCLGLLSGAAVTIAAIVTRAPALLLAGTVLAGLGFGPGNLGAYRVIMARAAASNRAGMISAVSTVNYLAFGLPALIAGVATTHFGLHDTALVYSAAIALLAAAAAGGVLFESRARTRTPQAAAPPAELPPGPGTAPPYARAVREEARRRLFTGHRTAPRRGSGEPSGKCSAPPNAARRTCAGSGPPPPGPRG